MISLINIVLSLAVYIKNIFKHEGKLDSMNGNYWDDFEDYELAEIYDIKGYVEGLADKVDKAFSDLNEDYHPAYLGVDNAARLYSLIRENKPSTVIETGVCNGMSSTMILKALEDNKKGKLYSVDLPVVAGSIEGRTGAVLPPGKSSGWVVPEEYKHRWDLLLGNTYYVLPKIFQEIGETDIFIHDSGHSYETMMFEFGIAWYHLNETGFLIADNTDKNDAFRDFARAKKRKLYRMNYLALLAK